MSVPFHVHMELYLVVVLLVVGWCTVGARVGARVGACVGWLPEGVVGRCTVGAFVGACVGALVRGGGDGAGAVAHGGIIPPPGDCHGGWIVHGNWAKQAPSCNKIPSTRI
jgi:hypothetical protein